MVLIDVSFAFLDRPDINTLPSSTAQPEATTEKSMSIRVPATKTTLTSSSGKQGTVLANEDKTTAFPPSYIGIAIGAIFIILLVVAFMFYKRYALLVFNMQPIQKRLFFILYRLG